MLNAMLTFAEDSPVVHVSPLKIFEIAGLQITNSIFYGWVISLLMIIGFVLIARKVTIRPKGGVIQLVEAGVTFVSNMVQNSFNDKSIGRKYIPFFVTLFFFVLINNWMGLMLGVGEPLKVNGNPVFRPFTADLNGTLAIGLVTMLFVYAASIREVGGVRNYIGHFFMGSPLNPLYLVIGLIEMLTDLTRALSLALRLFLNVAIGEIVIAVFAFLGGMLAPGNILSPVAALPFTLLELGVGALQAYIFVILGVNYLAITVNSAHAHREHEESAEVPSLAEKAVA